MRMSNRNSSIASREILTKVASGWSVLIVHILLLVVLLALILFVHSVVLGLILSVAAITLAGGLIIPPLFGYFTLQPNMARVLILFGSYKGTVRDSGFHWVNPFYWRSELSLRANNLNIDTLKVNDKRGNPVEIAAVVVWRVNDTAMAKFDVERYDSYVKMQSEAALRSIASRFAYDHGEQHEPTLRDSADEVAQALTDELQARLMKAGVVVEESRLTHLAYAPEIASVMLRRQQAEAIVAARRQIVRGAISMVQMALQELEEGGAVQLDAERKAAMVSNLLVVLCGNADATPMINTGA
jgi:regulator of protease activity HflC (stomatin/prohibitin superfamily)